jgi:predicted MPP superfamily phosphohydrolase
LAWLGFFLLGFMAVCVATLVCVDSIKLIFRISDFGLRAFSENQMEALDHSRRQFLFTLAPWGAFGLSGLLSWRGYQSAMAGPQVKTVKIPKLNLSKALEGFRIVQISDLHIGNLIRRPYVEKVVQQTLELKPDLIVLTGDMVDGSPEGLTPHLEPLRELSCKYGVFFVTGNHEYYSGSDDWIKYFSETGVQVLMNSHRMLEVQNSSQMAAKLAVLGIPDPTAARFGKTEPNIFEAAEGSEAADFILLLAHQPNAYREAEKIKCDLQLSGHTHSGQFYPVRFLIGLFHRYYQGLHRHNEKFWIYVNQGTGFWGPPNRLGLPSEITLLELTEGKEI